MKQTSNLATSSTLRRRKLYNSVTESTTISPDDLGVNITKSVFGYKTPTSGILAPNGADMGTNAAASAWIDQYGMPFIFVVGGSQILLPPIVQKGGTPVPPLPDGLTVQWAPSFMNVAIPAGFLSPICTGGKLGIYPGEMPGAQSLYPIMYDTSITLNSWTNNLLISGGDKTQPNQGETLLRLIMAVMECLIYSYSSYPWGNQYADLQKAVMDNRNLANFLQYPYAKASTLANVLSDVGIVYTKVVDPVVGAALNVVAPGTGTAFATGANALFTKAGTALTKAQTAAPAQVVNSAETTSVAPAGVSLQDQGGAVVATSTDLSDITSSPILILVIIGIILFIVL